MDRRKFLGAMGLAGAGLASGAGRALASGPASLNAGSGAGRPGSAPLNARSGTGGSRTWDRGEAGVRLGVASYSLRELSRKDAIAAILQMGVSHVNLKSFHLEYELSPAELAAGVAEFKAAGLQIVGGGTITLQEDTDEAMRASFEYARAAGFPVMVVAPRPETLPRIERFAIEYDIRIAIHNHGPEDPFFPAPSDALALVRGMDPRMGVCVDVGHTARTGKDVVREIAGAGNRLHDMHMKDLADLSDRASQCIVGQGLMPVAAIFRQLQVMNYPGYVNLEYEIDAKDPVPGMLRSFDYMRGVLAGMGE